MRTQDEVQPDDVDRLFAELRPVDPPGDLLAGVLTSVGARPLPPRAVPWLLVNLAALALLGLVAVLLGQALATSGTLDILTLALVDSDLLASGAEDLLAALIESLPWANLASLAAALALVVVAARCLGRELGRGAPLAAAGGPVAP